METRPFDEEEIAGKAGERQWLNSLLAGVGSSVRLAGTKADIPALQSLLSAGPFTESAAVELEIIGGAFGDVIANELGLQWVVAQDEFGTDFALQVPTRAVLVFPRDMIVKRVERGEDVSQIDLAFMLDRLAETVAGAAANSADMP